ncbi:MAG: phosphate ABC transporter substrate-binding protein PstS [Tropheryma whipplei]|uniref:phosphate ABC transporter substrate-binding protein PstS n=1 Tax=Tropheryma whipplei TaxID=2039 RepID=UPI000000C850|nr:phosphate ABC transporter substrate-binding protein PstS [Tropheryma whipplei]MCO8182384.1 phosphate ABC transporter substrate-binding protein PstS [Tropheryma whipplei]CAD67085.1 ABC transporter phosphate-binding lipoprotein [Tropheryma whipplei TW08/27]
MCRLDRKLFLVFASVVTLFSVSCFGNSKTSLEGSVSVTGASSQSVAQSVWISEFRKIHPGVTVNYEPQGSGAGRRAFLSGAVDLAATDVPFADPELTGDFKGCTADGPLQLPVYISPIAIAYNLPGVSDLKLDASVIAGIFSGAITTWDSPRISALNPGIELPSKKITAVHRSDNSGTTENFSDYIHTNAPSDWPHKPSTKFPYTYGEAAKGTSGVAQVLKATVGSIGYLDLSLARGMSLATLKVGSGFSKPSAESATLTVSDSEFPSKNPNSFSVKINRRTEKAGAWPLILVSYVVACVGYKKGNKDAIFSYLKFILSEKAQGQAAQQAGSAPLPESLSKKLLELVNKIAEKNGA